MSPLHRACWALLLSVLLLHGAPAFADPAPKAEAAQSAEVRAAERAALFEALKAAPNEMSARAIEDKIWRSWMIGPNDAATETLARALQQMRYGAYDSAHAMLSRLVETDPDYSEAWNQRAHLRFLTADYAGSLIDIEKVLALEPKHFGALSGRGLILLRIGDKEGALEAIEAAAAVHPFITERHLIPELTPNGTPL